MTKRLYRKVKAKIKRMFTLKKQVEIQPTRLNIGIEEKGIHEGIFLYTHDCDDVIFLCIRKFQSWELIETAFILDNVKSGDIVIDLGANLGYYTTIFSKLVGSSGRVLAFEPCDANYSLLRRNIELNKLNNVYTFKAIVSDEHGFTHLYENDASNMGAHTAIYTEGLKFDNMTIHPQVTLDDLIKVGLDRIDFIKMDTQGAEPLIFRGGQNLIRANASRLKMVVGFCPGYIRNLGIEPIDFYNQIISFGFEGSYIDLVAEKVNPAENIRDLIQIVESCDGVTWPKNVSFVDLVLTPPNSKVSKD